MTSWLFLLALGLTGVARADISDSGNLTIGGQAVIAGSMTVAGSGGILATDNDGGSPKFLHRYDGTHNAGFGTWSGGSNWSAGIWSENSLIGAFQSNGGLAIGSSASGAAAAANGITVPGAARLAGEVMLGGSATNGIGQIGSGDSLGNGAHINLCASANSSCGGTGAAQYFTKGGGDADHIWYTDQGGGSVERMRLSGSTGLTLAPGQTNASTFTLSGNYSLITSTGINIAAGELKFDAGSSGIVWPDGSRSTTAAGSGTPSVFVSSYVQIGYTTFTDPAFGPCFTGSTITITEQGGGTTKVWYSGFLNGDTNYGTYALTFLKNGEFVSPLSDSLPASQNQPISATANNSMMGNFEFSFPSTAGTNSYCLIRKRNSGTGLMGCSTIQCQFGAQETK